MTREEIGKMLSERNEEALMADGFEDAFVGIAQQFNGFCACYDIDKCIKVMIDRDGMDEDEAIEYFEYNVTGAYVGEFTPMFLSSGFDDEQIEDMLIEYNDDAFLADGFEEALVGMVQQFNTYSACYDYNKCIEIIIERDGITKELAEEFLEDEIYKNYDFENSPVFLHVVTKP